MHRTHVDVSTGEVTVVPYTAEEEAAYLDALANPPAPPVPAHVTRRQALQQLRIEGITEGQIIANIAAMEIPELQKDLALIEFKESQVFERARPLVATLGAMLGKDAAGIDTMFIEAAKL